MKHLTLLAFFFKILLKYCCHDGHFCDIFFPVSEMKNGELLRRSKGFLIHVGGLCPSVSEVCPEFL